MLFTLTPTQWFSAIAVGIFLVMLDWQVSGEVFKRAARIAGPIERRRSAAPAPGTFGERVLQRMIDASEDVLPYAAFGPAACAGARESAQAQPQDEKGAFREVA